MLKMKANGDGLTAAAAHRMMLPQAIRSAVRLNE